MKRLKDAHKTIMFSFPVIFSQRSLIHKPDPSTVELKNTALIPLPIL